MGHEYVELKNYNMAIECYRNAIDVSILSHAILSRAILSRDMLIVCIRLLPVFSSLSSVEDDLFPQIYDDGTCYS